MKIIVLLIVGYVVYRAYQSGWICDNAGKLPLVGDLACGKRSGSGYGPQLVPNVSGGGLSGGGGGAF